MVTHLAQNQFITNSEMHTSESAVAQQAPPIASATAAPFDEPSMTMEVPQRAPAGLAPNTAAPAGALEAPWEGPWWLVLAEVLEFPPIELTDEVPLFLRDGDHLRRWNA